MTDRINSCQNCKWSRLHKIPHLQGLNVKTTVQRECHYEAPIKGGFAVVREDDFCKEFDEPELTIS